MLFRSKLFTEREVVTGRNIGFKFFNINKAAIMNLMEDAAKIFDEEMSTEDKLMIRAGLGKVSLSGMYRVENIYDLIDNLRVRLRLRNIGPLVNLELNYRYKLSDMNKENSIKAPTEYKEWYGQFGTFEDDWFDEEEF